MSKTRLAGLLLISALITGPATAFDRIVIFGDSLSDTGNLAAITFNLPPPFFQNRITNGPVAVDVLTAHYGLNASASRHVVSMNAGDNYAVAGGNASGLDAEDLPFQYAAFTDNNPGPLDANTLVVMVIGSNDVRDARNQASSAGRNAVVDAAIGEIEDTLESLLARGARRILVANSPDISRVPETLDEAAGDPGVVARSQQATARFNQGLRQVVDGLAGAKGKVTVLDLAALLEDIIAAPANYGLTNVTDACFRFSELSFHPDCNFDTFAFFDTLHPTAAVHAIVGDAMISALTSVSGSGSQRPFVPTWIPLLLE